MDRCSTKAKRFHLLLVQSIALGLLIAAMAMAGLPPDQALADVPNFPSRTPTITPTVTATVTLTPPIGTSTVLPPAIFTATITNLPTLTAEINIPTRTPSPEVPGGGIGCWPFALFFLLAIILGITYYFTRRTHADDEEYPG